MKEDRREKREETRKKREKSEERREQREKREERREKSDQGREKREDRRETRGLKDCASRPTTAARPTRDDVGYMPPAIRETNETLPYEWALSGEHFLHSFGFLCRRRVA